MVSSLKNAKNKINKTAVQYMYIVTKISIFTDLLVAWN